MNLYNVVLGKASGVINVRSYVVAAVDEHNAIYGDAVRRQLDEYLTDRSTWSLPEDEAIYAKIVMSTLFEFELPLTREETDKFTTNPNWPLREFEILLIAENVNQYDNGEVICCDYCAS